MKLKIENFKSLTNEKFDLNRVNILIGENSAGKSSLLKFFLLLKQSLKGSSSSSSFNLTLKGERFDFGNFKDIISFNQVEKKIVFEIEFLNYHEFFVDFFGQYFQNMQQKYPQTVEDFINLTSNNKVTLKCEIDSNLKNHEGSIVTISSDYLGEITLKSRVKDNVVFQDDYCNLTLVKSGVTTEYKSLEFDREAFLKYIKREGLMAAIKDEKKLTDEKDIVKELLPFAFLLISQNYLESVLNKIEYINPIDSNPKRYFFFEAASDKSSKIDLESIVNVLNDDDIITSDIRDPLMNTLNEALAYLGIADEIKFDSSDNIPVIELKAKIYDFWSNITDVGYGLSLQLPVLFRTIIAGLVSEKRLIFIEQPEVHLHPQLQAKFIETIIKYGGNSTFYIETHSEHIIRKLQSLVKHKNYGLTKDDVSIYYFKREKKGSVISKHLIEENGKLSRNFPSGFFDTSYLLAKELL